MTDARLDSLTDVVGIALLFVSVALLLAVDLIPTSDDRHRLVRTGAAVAFSGLIAIVAWRFVELAG